VNSKQNSIANIVDAESSIDDNMCKIKVGEVFVAVENDEAEEWVKQVQEEMSKLEKQHAEVQTEMEALKVLLYSKFGKAINLENAEQRIND